MNNQSADFIPISQPYLTASAQTLVLDCLQTGWISSRGVYVEQFEQAFAALVGCEYAVSVSNGTAALHLALLALGIGPGDEVIVPDLTFAATANAVLHCGATPVLCDVSRSHWTLEIDALKACITANTKAIIPVHLYGNPADMTAINQIAQTHNLALVEDCAESLGARYQGKATGSIGHLGCFSFFANKMITTGEGGMVTTNDAALAEKVRCFRDHGMLPARRYWHEVAGLNYRMTNIQAALGLSQLECFEQFAERRQAIELQYQTELADVPGISFKQVLPQATAVNWLTSLVIDPLLFGATSVQLFAFLQQHQVECRPFFYPLHQQPPYAADAAAFSQSAIVSAQGLSLPTFYTLTQVQISRVCDLIKLAQTTFSSPE